MTPRYQMIDLIGEAVTQPDGTVTLHFAVTGLEPRQVQAIGDKLSAAIKEHLAAFSDNGELITRDLNEKPQ